MYFGPFPRLQLMTSDNLIFLCLAPLVSVTYKLVLIDDAGEGCAFREVEMLDDQSLVPPSLEGPE